MTRGTGPSTIRLLALLALLLGGAASAHADMAQSTPAGNTTVTELPGAVQLVFTEPVETLFSVFKVYRLEADVDMAADSAWKRLNGLAGALVNEVLTANDAGAEARVDEGVETASATTAEVSLSLPDDLAPGVYVVMWRVLSIDTHSTQGFLVFEYVPATE